jgi:hypothetical protein
LINRNAHASRELSYANLSTGLPLTASQRGMATAPQLRQSGLPPPEPRQRAGVDCYHPRVATPLPWTRSVSSSFRSTNGKVSAASNHNTVSASAGGTSCRTRSTARLRGMILEYALPGNPQHGSCGHAVVVGGRGADEFGVDHERIRGWDSISCPMIATSRFCYRRTCGTGYRPIIWCGS